MTGIMLLVILLATIVPLILYVLEGWKDNPLAQEAKSKEGRRGSHLHLSFGENQR